MPISDDHTNPLWAAELTPPGPAGVAVIALGGPAAEVQTVVRTTFVPHRGAPPDLAAMSASGQLRYGRVIDACGESLDDGLLCVTAWPSGDDVSPVGVAVVELHLHGSAGVMAAVRQRLGQVGVSWVGRGWPPAPPENLSLAEELRIAGPDLPSWRAVELLSPQADPDGPGLAGLAHRALAGHRPDPQTIVAFAVARHLIVPPRVVIVGPVNAGKSTLANALLGRSAALVSSVAGTTRDALDEPGEIAGLAVRIIDTAGERQTTDDIERQGIARAVEQSRQADVLLRVKPADTVNLRHEAVEPEASALAPAGVITVISKCDRQPDWFAKQGRDTTPPTPGQPPKIGPTVYVSSVTAQGLDELRAAILRQLGLSDLQPQRPIVFTPRQEGLVAAALAGRTLAWRELLDGRFPHRLPGRVE